MKTYFHALNIKPIYISPANHGSNRSERYIRTLTDIIIKNLEGTADDWPMYVGPACSAMNRQISLVTKFSPYDIMYLRTPPDNLDFDFDPDKTGIKVDVKQYMNLMKQRVEVINKLVRDRKKIKAETQYIREMRRYPNDKPFRVGDLVFLDYSGNSKLQAPSRKLKRNWIGPLKIHQILDDTYYIVTYWNERLLSPKIHSNRLKKCTLNLQEIDSKGHLQIANNVKDFFNKWEVIHNDIIEKE